MTSSTSWNQQFDYDSLNRLERVKEFNSASAQLWQQEYVYDRWGNRTIHQTNTWGPASGPLIPEPNFGVDSANNNRLTAPASHTMTYDAAGNLTTDTLSGAVTRVYDAENRMISETRAGGNLAGRYTYNADGQRVRREGDGTETWQVYGMEGELLAEYAANGGAANPQKEYGYRNGQLLIVATAPAGLAANNPPTAEPRAAGESSAFGTESKFTDARQSLLAFNKSFDLPEWRDIGDRAAAISDTSTPLDAFSFSLASLLRSLFSSTPQSSAAKIAFASNRDGAAQLYSMNTDGSALVRLTDNAANDEAPNWSPNNSRIVFQSDRNNLFSGSADIYVMNADGSGQTRLTSDAADDSAPVWSPDGTKIAFQSARNGVNYQVYVMNADGSGQVNISNNSSNEKQPSWSPDGTKLAFASDRDQPGFAKYLCDECQRQ